MSHPRFSVIIPTCHRNDLLAQCLERLSPKVQTLGDDAYEVIVSDDGVHTTAKTLIESRFKWAAWISGPKRGPAANRNTGAKAASSPWLVFCDDDCLPSTQYLATFDALVRSQDSLQVIEGRTHADRPKERMDEVSPINESGGFLWSCNFAIKRELFNRLKGFDEDYPYASMEDVDLRERIKSLGIDILFSPDASVCHPWRRGAGLAAVTKAIASHRIFWHKHPQHLHKHSPSIHLHNLARTLVKRTIPDLFLYRCRGISFATCELILLARLFTLSMELRRKIAPPKKSDLH